MWISQFFNEPTSTGTTVVTETTVITPTDYVEEATTRMAYDGHRILLKVDGTLTVHTGEFVYSISRWKFYSTNPYVTNSVISMERGAAALDSTLILYGPNVTFASVPPFSFSIQSIQYVPQETVEAARVVKAIDSDAGVEEIGSEPVRAQSERSRKVEI